MKPAVIAFFCLATLISLPVTGQYITSHPELMPVYSPTGRPRMAAEWEPAIGVLVTWPLSLPKNLIIEFAKDSKLYILVESRQAQKDVVNVLTKWGITPDKVRFIPAPMGVDAWWTRDWGPHAVFTPNGTLHLADAKYEYATPFTGLACDDSLNFLYYDDQNQIIKTTKDDHISEFIFQSTGYEILNLPFAFTGGNVITDGQRSGFSTCVLTNENRFLGISDEKFFRDVRQLLGIESHHIISNFEEEGIQHIDCFMKMLDEERLFVMRPPADHPLYEQYEGIVKHELSYLTNAYGRPYQILRIDTDRYAGDELAAYSNSLILNKVIYVPLFGIPQDSVALQQWADAMPGYSVKGFEFITEKEKVMSEEARKHYGRLGWKGSDALHCRTRAIWDPEMIYISVDRLLPFVAEAKTYTVKAIIKDYSLEKLIPESLKLIWRNKDEKDWREITLDKGEIQDQYIGVIPGSLTRNEVEYYISAESSSGRKETMPRVAPEGVYHFTIDVNRK